MNGTVPGGGRSISGVASRRWSGHYTSAAPCVLPPGSRLEGRVSGLHPDTCLYQAQSTARQWVMPHASPGPSGLGWKIKDERVVKGVFLALRPRSGGERTVRCRPHRATDKAASTESCALGGEQTVPGAVSPPPPAQPSSCLLLAPSSGPSVNPASPPPCSSWPRAAGAGPSLWLRAGAWHAAPEGAGPVPCAGFCLLANVWVDAGVVTRPEQLGTGMARGIDTAPCAGARVSRPSRGGLLGIAFDHTWASKSVRLPTRTAPLPRRSPRARADIQEVPAAGPGPGASRTFMG